MKFFGLVLGVLGIYILMFFICILLSILLEWLRGDFLNV